MFDFEGLSDAETSPHEGDVSIELSATRPGLTEPWGRLSSKNQSLDNGIDRPASREERSAAGSQVEADVGTAEERPSVPADATPKHVYELWDTVITIGRETCCTIVVQDLRVSRLHCQLKLVGCEAFLEDLSSSATYVNGIGIGQHSLHQLRNGDILSLVLGVEPVPFDISFTFESLLNNPRTPLNRERPSSLLVDAQHNLCSATETDTAAAPLEAPSPKMLCRTTTVGYKAPTDVFQEEFLCGVCREIFWKPLTLVPCAHSFCASCLSEWQQSRLPQKLTCPFCRDTQKVNMVFVNHSFRNLVNGYLAMHPSKAISFESQTEKDQATTLKDTRMPLVINDLDECKRAVDEATDALIAATNSSQVHRALDKLRETIRHWKSDRVKMLSLPALNPLCDQLRTHESNVGRLHGLGVEVMYRLVQRTHQSLNAGQVRAAVLGSGAVELCAAVLARHSSNTPKLHALYFFAYICRPQYPFRSGMLNARTASPCVKEVVARGVHESACIVMQGSPENFLIQHRGSLLVKSILETLQVLQEISEAMACQSESDDCLVVFKHLQTVNMLEHLRCVLARFGSKANSTPDHVGYIRDLLKILEDAGS